MAVPLTAYSMPLLMTTSPGPRHECSHFGPMRAVEVTTIDIDAYNMKRKAAGLAPATIRRELEGLRAAFNYAADQTPPLFPRNMVPTISMPEVHNTRSGFFTLADVTALLKAMPDSDLRDFIEWGFRTGMRKGEISKLTWSMLEQGEPAWVLRIPGSITKNGEDRALAFDGDARRILERRFLTRRLDCPLIFHRSGRHIGAFDERWLAALTDAHLPEGMLFHDLRRSAVRTLIRAGVDQSTAMKVSGHKTDSMFRRYNIITEEETLAAMRKADAYLSTQPTTRNVLPMAVNAIAANKLATGRPRKEEGQFGDKRALTADGDWCRRWDLNPH